jgi:Leucine-rich repeat (LRR) protein
MLVVVRVLSLADANYPLRADEVPTVASDREILDAISYFGVPKTNHKGEVTRISHTVKLGQDADKVLSDIARLPRLESFTYANHTRSATELEHLKNVTTLKELHLRNINVTDDTLKHFSGLTSLERLMVYYARTPLRVTDEGMAHLKKLTKLQRLNLPNTQITDKGLGHLNGMTKLQVLGLYECKATGIGFANLRLPELYSVHLMNSPISDAGLKALAECSSPAQLVLRDCRDVSDEGLAHLKDLIQLTSLDLSGTNITDAGLVHLQTMQRLQHLKLERTKITDAGLAHLARLSKLDHIHLAETGVNPEAVLALRAKLRELHGVGLAVYPTTKLYRKRRK